MNRFLSRVCRAAGPISLGVTVAANLSRKRSRWAAAAVGRVAALGTALAATSPPPSSDGPTTFVQPNNITINDGAATPYSSDLQVAGMNGVITDVRATIHNISHTYPDDIQMVLVSPSGDKVELMNDT